MTDEPDWFTPATSTDIAAMQATLDTINGNTSGINSDLHAANVNVGVARTQLVALGALVGVVLYNNDPAVTVWVGGSGVVAGQGTPLLPGDYHSWVLGPTAILYGITAAGTVSVSINYGYIQV